MQESKVRTTCANCQFICSPDRSERERRYALLTEGGIVIQHPDGYLEAVAPEEARAYLASMPPEKSLYEEVDSAGR